MLVEGTLLEMLTDHDIAFALEATGSKAGPGRDRAVRTIREAPEILAVLLDDPRVYAAVASGGGARLVGVSPFFFFSLLLRQARRELRRRSFTAEWLGPRRRLPVFDAPAVASVLADEAVLAYLAETLASFTSLHRPDPEGATRFHELDLADLHALLDDAAGPDRFAVDRRLGDVALFLAGVFPDSARGAPDLRLWEVESRTHYQSAAQSRDARRCGLATVLAGLAAELRPVRKALNYLTDRYLYPLRAEWFVSPV